MIRIPALLLSIILAAFPEHGWHKANDAELQRWFKGANETYFEGKLDPKTEVHFRPDLRDGLTGKPVMGRSAYSAPWYIDINDKYSDTGAVWQETLYHEMCHQKVNALHVEFDDHGPRWHECMYGLVRNHAFDVDAQGRGIF